MIEHEKLLLTIADISSDNGKQKESERISKCLKLGFKVFIMIDFRIGHNH